MTDGLSRQRLQRAERAAAILGAGVGEFLEWWDGDNPGREVHGAVRRLRERYVDAAAEMGGETEK